MMLACLDRRSRTPPRYGRRARVGVNALAAGQHALARRFSAKGPESEKWEGVEWSERLESGGR